MNILWSPDLSLATPALNLMGPQLVRALEGDDLGSYCAARLLADEIGVFKPGPLAAIGDNVKYDAEGTPILVPEIDDREDGYLTNDFSWFLSRFGALQRIFEASPNAIGILLHDPASLPSAAVASYVGFFDDPKEQEQVHQELANFLHDIVASLPGSGPGAPLFFTGNPLLGRLYLEAQPELTRENTLSLLATSGITFALPRVAALTEEGLNEVHEALQEERENYIEALNETISNSYSALKSGDIAEAYRFAEFAVNTKIQAEASKVERAASKLNKNVLKRLGIQFTEGLPSLLRAAANPLGAVEVGFQILSILVGSLASGWKEPQVSEEYPLGSYVYKIRRELDKHATQD